VDRSRARRAHGLTSGVTRPRARAATFWARFLSRGDKKRAQVASGVGGLRCPRPQAHCRGPGAGCRVPASRPPDTVWMYRNMATSDRRACGLYARPPDLAGIATRLAAVGATGRESCTSGRLQRDERKTNTRIAVALLAGHDRWLRGLGGGRPFSGHSCHFWTEKYIRGTSRSKSRRSSRRMPASRSVARVGGPGGVGRVGGRGGGPGGQPRVTGPGSTFSQIADHNSWTS
jgi:hypothetical protein